MPPSNLLKQPASRSVKIGIVLLLIVLFIVSCLGVGGLFLNQSIHEPAKSFPVGSTITITPGSSARSVAEQFRDAGYVRSAWSLYLSLIWWHDPTDIKAATYRFSEPLSPRKIAHEITTGHFAYDLISLTIPEGERATTIATIAAQVLPEFDTERFLFLATPTEGKLFPDTYFVPETFTADELYMLLTETYRERVSIPYFASSSTAYPLTETEVIILASILEREANTPESMKLVAGILQNRLEIGMALQVDASMEYVLSKPLKELQPEDLDIDSPYNTYLYSGLPPTPIGNPGLTAVRAILEPTPSEYFYYITGTDGEFYYARTFEEHRSNIDRYLR